MLRRGKETPEITRYLGDVRTKGDAPRGKWISADEAFADRVTAWYGGSTSRRLAIASPGMAPRDRPSLTTRRRTLMSTWVWIVMAVVVVAVPARRDLGRSTRRLQERFGPED